MKTVYRPVPDLLDVYAGIDGSIVKAGYGKLVQKSHPSKGYLYVYIPGVGTREVHPLVAAAYLGPRPDGMQVRHGDHNRINSSVGNLCYGTPKQNTQDSIVNGTHSSLINTRKTKCPQGHSYDSAYIKPSTGWRSCPECQPNHNRKTEEKQRQISKTNGQHLTPKQRLDLVHELLTNFPSLSDREIARKSGSTHTTVARHRRNATPTKEG